MIVKDFKIKKDSLHISEEKRTQFRYKSKLSFFIMTQPMEVQSHSATLALSIEKPNYGYYRFILSALLILVTKTLIFSQNNQLETDKGLLQSIAPYSSDVRQSILMASQNQNVLDRAQQIRTRSQKSFQDLIKGFGQKSKDTSMK
jgi:hypothetical protein